MLLIHIGMCAAAQADLRYEGARAVLRVAGVRGQHLHEALAAFNSGRMCAVQGGTIASGRPYTERPLTAYTVFGGRIFHVGCCTRPQLLIEEVFTAILQSAGRFRKLM